LNGELTRFTADQLVRKDIEEEPALQQFHDNSGSVVEREYFSPTGDGKAGPSFSFSSTLADAIGAESSYYQFQEIWLSKYCFSLCH